MKCQIASRIILATLLMAPAVASSFEVLDDEELHSVTAGSASAAHDSDGVLSRIPLRYSNGRVSMEGEILVIPTSSYIETSTLQLMDNAQSNLRSLININAVNSPVNVLLNLNINVNSSIVNMSQINQLLSQ